MTSKSGARSSVFSKLPYPEVWRALAVLVPAIIILTILINTLLLPRFEAWVLSRIPGGADIKTALERQFPRSNVSIRSITRNPGSDTAQLTLFVGLTNKDYLTPGQLADAKRVTCAALGRNASRYADIRLQNMAERRFLVFYSTQNRSENLSCKPS